MYYCEVEIIINVNNQFADREYRCVYTPYRIGERSATRVGNTSL